MTPKEKAQYTVKLLNARKKRKALDALLYEYDRQAQRDKRYKTCGVRKWG